jgi:hypothetical protein
MTMRDLHLPMPPHSPQPQYDDHEGVWRFRRNAIIDWLFDSQEPMNLNRIAVLCANGMIASPDIEEDQRQLAQLLGHSVDGYQDLSYSAGEPPDLVARAIEWLAARTEAIEEHDTAKTGRYVRLGKAEAALADAVRRMMGR